MHYEIWGRYPDNLVAVAESETEACTLVQQLLTAGWDVEDLALGVEPDEGDATDNLPPVLQGERLKEWLHALA